MSGGSFDRQGNLLELGLWEKEERRHTPALGKIYQQLSGHKWEGRVKPVKPYQPSENPREDLYRHGLHRVITEYGAAGLYLWLMAHATGALQQVLHELLQDEINHMAKFWGFGLWAFPDHYGHRLQRSLRQWLEPNSPAKEASHLRSTQDLVRTFRHFMDLVDWSSWSWLNRGEIFYTFGLMLVQLLRWSQTLSPAYLEELLGSDRGPLSPPPITHR
ncbi:ferritin-like domain-containing protein [Neosynechococcus sphagnicola]|uniref:ferritin-like domain-containing protein n=1 Tax=Neosynechococcus sphagnicola TaxID=1501145 RepID=UPI000B136B12|nr:ferritin-like domain-containing protein [Neosynechococcus sphagnicola]